jgi:hypothetical protein
MNKNEAIIWYWTNRDVPGHEHGLAFHHWTNWSDVRCRVLIVQFPGAPEYFVLARKLASLGPYSDFDKAKKYAECAVDCSVAYEDLTPQEQVANLKACWAELAEREIMTTQLSA